MFDVGVLSEPLFCRSYLQYNKTEQGRPVGPLTSIPKKEV